MKTNILGVNVDADTFAEALEKAIGFLNENRPHMIFTPNPEMIMAAKKDPGFRDILNSADLVIPDGIGVVLASKLNRTKIKERVTGYDLLLAIFDIIKNKNINVYLFGSAPGVALEAKSKLEKRFPGLKICGLSDGYYDAEKEKQIIADIIQKKPDIVLVGTGMVRQEKWINKNKNMLGAKILAGVGGSLDGFSGKVKRAPKIYRRLGLEWLYRLASEPKRIKRQIYLPAFALSVVWSKVRRRG